MDKVLDEYGLVPEGGLLTVFIPCLDKAFVFRVKSRVNRGFEILNYGALPLDSGDTVTSYDGGTSTVPADGVIPSRSYTSGLNFDTTSDYAYDTSDMWYLPLDYKDRIFHTYLYVTPAWLRCEIEIPLNVGQYIFQKTHRVGVAKDFGFRRGSIEAIHFPYFHIGYVFGNDTNLNLYTFAKFVYGEYIIEIPRNPEIIFKAIIREIPSYFFTFQLQTRDENVVNAFIQSYGIDGFPVYTADRKDEAIKTYSELLKKVIL